MKVGIMQPYFFPYLGYWQLINSVDVFIIYDDVNFIKQGWINRNYILNYDKKFLFTLQLEGSSSFKLINEINIGNNNTKLIKTLTQFYNKAFYFNDVISLLEKIILNKEKNLGIYLEYLIKEICRYLKIETEILISSKIEKNNSLKGQDKVIEICKLLNASCYINPLGGQQLYDKKIFAYNNIDLYFLQTNQIEYKQFTNEFIPSLSIIDILMFNSVEEIKNHLTQFVLL
ncbi:MAG: WbqC family protein [Desulfobacteraceae bacterium]